MSQVLNKLGDLLKEKNLTIVTAESCTGGGLAFYLTRNKKTSPLLERGFVTYSAQAKQELLHVNPESLQLHGAVSKVVAVEMAEGALKNSGAQLSIATTGIAGSDITANEKPGVIWISFASILGKTDVFDIKIKGNRASFINTVIHEALTQFYKYLSNLT